jgi:hypothetical protein
MSLSLNKFLLLQSIVEANFEKGFIIVHDTATNIQKQLKTCF